MKIREGCLWIAPAMLWAGAALSNTDADPEGNTYRYEVPGFWNSTVATMESQLHITNPTAAVANIEIRGYYPNSVQADGVFSGQFGPKWSLDFSAQRIEEGGGISANGIGPAYADFPRWFLVLTSDQRLVVRHLVRHEGVWRNFSAAAVNVAQAPAPPPVPPTEPEPPTPEPPEPPEPPPEESGPIGVIAAGNKGAICSDGYAWRTVLNVADRASAIAQARLACRNAGLRGCEVGDWTNACGSVAVRTPASWAADRSCSFHFGSGPTEKAAETEASSSCEIFSGECEIAYDSATGYNATYCTGTAAQ